MYKCNLNLNLKGFLLYFRPVLSELGNVQYRTSQKILGIYMIHILEYKESIQICELYIQFSLNYFLQRHNAK